MRTIGNLPIPKTLNSKYPFSGAIRNETLTEQGTPVIKEIYNDPLMNLYQLLKMTGINPTETEDNDLTQYQIIQALEKFANKLNDLQQIMTIDATDINVNFNFDLLPEDYVFIGKLTENILASESYTLRGLGTNSYSITSSVDILASNLVLVVINSSGSSITSLNQLNALNDSLINCSFSSPLSFNNSNKMYYFSAGRIITDEPKSYDLQNIIQVAESNLNLSLIDAVFHKNKMICFCFDTAALSYRLFCFDPNNMSTFESEITIPSLSGVDNQPYIFCDEDFVYFTNSNSNLNISTDETEIGKFRFIPESFELDPVTDFNLHPDFEKTTNIFVNKDDQYFYTFISGNLWRYERLTATKTFLGFFNTLDGQVFRFNNKTYYTNGSVAVKWNL